MNKLPGFGLIERARSAGAADRSRSRRDRADRRSLTEPVVSALIDNGLYRALLPQSLGGAEASPEIFMQMLEEVAKADASTAWCLGQCSVCAMIAAYLDADAAHEIFNAPPGILAWGAIANEVQVVPGRISGHCALGFRQRFTPGELARRPRPNRRSGRVGAAEAQRRAGGAYHPVSGDQRHHVRRLGRDRPQRHRYRLLLG